MPEPRLSIDHLSITPSELVSSAVELYGGDARRRRLALMGMVQRFASRDTVPFFRGLLAVLQEQGLEDDFGVLSNIRPALDYWEGGDDERVLERLNPELREIIEEMVAQTHSSTT